MKRINPIIPVCLVVLALSASAAIATPFRLDAINGRYFVPDAEFDALNLNPALMTRVKGMDLILDLGLGLFSWDYVIADFNGIHHTMLTNDTATLSRFAFDSSASRLGFLSCGSKIGLGILLEPDYTMSNTIVSFDPNDQVSDSQDLQQKIFVRKGIPYNARLILAFPAGAGSVGFSAGFHSDPYQSRYEEWTNGTEIPMFRDATRRTKTTFDVDGGFTAGDNRGWCLGFSGGYSSSAGSDSPSVHPLIGANYIYTNDSFYFSDVLTGSAIRANAFLESKSGDSALVRVCGLFTKQGNLSLAEPNKAAIDLGMTNILRSASDSLIAADLDISRMILKSRGLFFWGLRLSFMRSVVSTGADNDTTAAAAFPGQELQTEDDLLSFGSDLTIGVEGSVLPWLTLRGSVVSSIFNYTKTDSVSKDLFLSPSETSSSGHSTFTALPQVSIIGGATVKMGKNSYFDIYTGLNLFGLDLYSDTFDKDRLVSVSNPVQVNPVDTQFRINLVLRLGLRFLI